jgi:pimeloyl-ACP methyl ester carboxylesterase
MLKTDPVCRRLAALLLTALLALPLWLQAAALEDEPVTLQAGGEFKALFRVETRGLPQGGVILIGDDAAPVDAARITNALRQQLPEHGWSTLAIELGPVASAKQPLEAWNNNQQRLVAAITHLQGRGIQNIALITHGSGATLAFDLLAKESDIGATAMVAINTTQPTHPEKIEPVTKLMAKIQLPMLDIFGGLDRTAAAQAKPRAAAGRQAALAASRNGQQGRFRAGEFAESSLIQQTGLIAYRQIRIDSADHWFSGMQDELVKRVRGWLARHAAGVKVQL